MKRPHIPDHTGDPLHDALAHLINGGRVDEFLASGVLRITDHGEPDVEWMNYAAHLAAYGREVRRRNALWFWQ